MKHLRAWAHLVPVPLAIMLLAAAVIADPITLTILYDNYIYQEGTLADWGFACSIAGTERTILFDTGYNGALLLQNCLTLGVDLEAIEDIVISHDHLDHTGGLNSVFLVNSNVTVYFGQSLPASFEENVVNHGATPVRVGDAREICRHVHSTGELLGPVLEQSLIVETDQGLIVMTGCSHPGIIDILQQVQALMNQPIYLVFGGFHLMGHTDGQVLQMIQIMQEMGVQKVGPTHCTGDRAIALFQAAYGDDFVPMGTGRIIVTADDIVSVRPQDAAGDTPSQVQLHGNHPNPFNPATWIGFDLPAAGMVRLSIFGPDGRRLVTLMDGTLPAGSHEIPWQGRDAHGHTVAAGPYLYRLECGDFVQTRKMLLMK